MDAIVILAWSVVVLALMALVGGCWVGLQLLTVWARMDTLSARLSGLRRSCPHTADTDVQPGAPHGPALPVPLTPAEPEHAAS